MPAGAAIVLPVSASATCGVSVNAVNVIKANAIVVNVFLIFIMCSILHDKSVMSMKMERFSHSVHII